jgi:uncharacterized membrane protein
MPQLIEKFTRASLEGFVNEGDSKDKKESYVNLASVLISFIIALVLISLIGKLLWNGVVTELFTCVRPAKSFMQILGLFVFVSLIL